MTKFVTVLKFFGCVAGGAVGTSMILIIPAHLFIGSRHLERLVVLMEVANPIAGVLGAVAGAGIYFRSDGRRRI